MGSKRIELIKEVGLINLIKQGFPLKVLFICSANVNRSVRFHRELQKIRPEWIVKSAGIWHGYPDQLNKTLLEWADIVFVMDLSHLRFIEGKYQKQFKRLSKDALIEVTGISDQYDVDDPELGDLFRYWFNRHWISVEK